MLTHTSTLQSCRLLWNASAHNEGGVCQFLHLAVLVQYWLVTDGHTMTAYTVLAWLRAVKITHV